MTGTNPKPRRAPVWLVQLIALALLGYFVYLEATITEFHVNRFILMILAGAILPPEIISLAMRTYRERINGNDSRGSNKPTEEN